MATKFVITSVIFLFGPAQLRDEIFYTNIVVFIWKETEEIRYRDEI